MALARWLDLRRLRRTRQVFTDPWRTHAVLGLLRRRPLKLHFRMGGELTLQRPRSFRPVLDWILSSRPSPLPVSWADGMVHFDYQGQRLGLRPDANDAYVFREVLLDDCYGIRALARSLGDAAHARPLGTVVDLGANVGLFSLLVSRLAQRVVAVEPMAANRDVARRNLARTIAQGRLRLVPAAVGDHDGTLRIHLSVKSSGHSIARELAEDAPAASHEDVPCVSLATLFAQQQIERCGLLKCDIEGAEYDVFAAAPLELLRRIDRIVLEAHLDRAAFPVSRFHALLARLRQAGFQCAEPPIDTTAPRQVLLVRAERSAEQQSVSRAA